MKKELFKIAGASLTLAGTASLLIGGLQRGKRGTPVAITLGALGVASGIALAVIPEIIDVRRKYDCELQISDEEIELIDRSIPDALGEVEDQTPAR